MNDEDAREELDLLHEKESWTPAERKRAGELAVYLHRPHTALPWGWHLPGFDHRAWLKSHGVQEQLL